MWTEGVKGANVVRYIGANVVYLSLMGLTVTVTGLAIGTSVRLFACLPDGDTSGSVLLLKPKEDTSSKDSYQAYRIVEMTSERWSFDFGEIDKGSAETGVGSKGSLGGSASVDGVSVDPARVSIDAEMGNSSLDATSTALAETLRSIDAEMKNITIGKTSPPKVYVPTPDDFKNQAEIPRSMVGGFIVVIIAFAFCKVVKLTGIVSKVDEGHFMNIYPAHVQTLLLPGACFNSFPWILQKGISAVFFLLDYLAFVLIPNFALMPLTSIAAEEAYINTAQMMYDEGVFLQWLILMGCGFAAFIIMIFNDMFLTTGSGHAAGLKMDYDSWGDMTPTQKIGRVIGGMMRVIVVAIACAGTIKATITISVHWNLLLGVDFKLAFRWSFRYGLVACASLLRMAVSVQTMIETVVSVAVLCAGSYNSEAETQEDYASKAREHEQQRQHKHKKHKKKHEMESV